MEDLKRLLVEIEADYLKFQNKGNKAAGTRARTGAMKLIKAVRAFRLELLNEAQNMKAESNA